jgi:putative DNA primase/helicase
MRDRITDIQRRADEQLEQADRDRKIKELAALGPIDYDLRRKGAAEDLSVSVAALDKEVGLARRTAALTTKLLFAEIEPAREAVNGERLLDTIYGEIRRYVILPEPSAVAVSLWVVYTYATDASFIAPLLAVTSPQKRCGKSSLLTLLNALVFRGLLVSNLSLAVLYRAVDQFRPTLLIDEADAFLDENEELRGLINAGHSRATARTLRMGGENRDLVEVFDAFGPKALAGIGARRDTITDRSITIELRRRRADERVDRLRQDRLDYTHLQSLMAGWAQQNLDLLRAADPVMPNLHDRAADNWRALVAIADLCGKWGAAAREAAVKLTASAADDDSVAVMLLHDLDALFERLAIDRIASAELVVQLAKLEHRPWPEWKNQKPITQRQVARLLSPFGITPKVSRIGSSTHRGYELSQFADSFSRYLPGVSSVTPSQVNGGAASRGFSNVTELPLVTNEKALRVSTGAGSYDVTDEIGVSGRGERESCPKCAGEGCAWCSS